MSKVRRKAELPPACSCDVLSPPARRPRPGFELTGSHRHLLHELLERWFQLEVESADSWTERLVAEAWWKRGPGRIRKPVPEADVDFQAWLGEHPVLASFGRMRGGEAAIFKWAGIPDLEAEAYVIHEVNGFTLAATAKRLGERESAVLQRVENARYRLAFALQFARFRDGEIAKVG